MYDYCCEHSFPVGCFCPLCEEQEWDRKEKTQMATKPKSTKVNKKAKRAGVSKAAFNRAAARVIERQSARTSAAYVGAIIEELRKELFK